MSESNELDDATQLSDRTVLSDKTVLSSGNTAQSAEATTNAAAPSTVKNSAGENAAEKNDTAEGNAEKSTVAQSVSSASGDGTEVSDETVLSDGTVISETPHARGGAAVGEADKSKGAPTVAIPTLPKRRGGAAAAGKAIRGKKSAQAKPSQAKSVQNKSAQSPVQNKTNDEAVSPVSDTGDNTTNNGPTKTGVDLDATQLSSIQHPTTAPAAKIPNVAFPKARTANTPVAAAARPVTANPAVANTNPQTPASANDIAYFKQAFDALLANVSTVVVGKAHPDPSMPDRPARRWPCPARRQPRHRQDSAGTRHRELDQRVVQAHPVHARPAAVRRGRHHLLRPEARRVRVPRGPGIRVHRARRRDQPSLAEDPVRTAGGHGGTESHRGRRHTRRAAAVHRDRHAEPDRTARHIQAARSPDGPFPHQDVGRVPRPSGKR